MSVQILLSRVSWAELAGGGCTVSTVCTTPPVPGWLEQAVLSRMSVQILLSRVSWAELAGGGCTVSTVCKTPPVPGWLEQAVLS